MNRTISTACLCVLTSLTFATSTFSYSSADFSDDNWNDEVDYTNYSESVQQESSDVDRYDMYAENSVRQYPGYYEDVPIKKNKKKHKKKSGGSYTSRMPQSIDGYGEKVIIINPRKHAWGAYTADGKLLRSGLATAGAGWCPDIRRSCRTKSGSFRINSLGPRSCYSKRYPVGRGGAPMPYCMFFNGNQGLHGSYQVVDGNASHGCVRVTVSDATWIRFNFANIGTKVIVTSY